MRGDTGMCRMALVFTGDEYADGAGHIVDVFSKHNLKASFFFTGNFYANKRFRRLIKTIKDKGHYLGAHSDKHLLYCDWNQRDSLLVTKQQFLDDLANNYEKMKSFGIDKKEAVYFLPPYEWFNDTIAAWTKEVGLHLVNFSAGTRTNADYTTPVMHNYRSSETIFNSVMTFDKKSTTGFNGFIMLIHIGTDPARTDKFYHQLERLIEFFKSKKYKLVRIDELLKED